MINKRHAPFIARVAAVLFIPLFWILFIIISLFTVVFIILQVNALRKLIRKDKKLSVLILEVVPKDNAGYIYRSRKWQQVLKQQGISCNIYTLFATDKTYDTLLNTPYLLVVLFLVSICKRFIQCLAAFNADVVIVRRELLIYNDYGNLFMEKFLRSINNKLVLDFDDDISYAKREPRNISLYGKLLLELPDKFIRTCGFYNYFTPGSTYLKENMLAPYTTCSEKNVMVLPTLVDYNKFEPKKYNASKKTITFGWSGSPNNYHNLPVILDALNSLSPKYEFDFVLIGRYPFNYTTKFKMRFIKYTAGETMELLHHIDVGVMPLVNNEESRGKCGFKLIQYMGCGIVSVASAITVNNNIVDDKINGFLVYNESQWAEVLEEVIQLKDRFGKIGKKAFEKISADYSFDAYTQKNLQFIRFVSQ